jgi:putative tricarboxylic transport membrane protein
VGIILGPLAEAQLRNAVAIGEGSFTVFFQRPMCVALLVLVAAILVGPAAFKRLRGSKR